MIEAPGFNCTLAPWNSVRRESHAIPSHSQNPFPNAQCKISNDTSYSTAFREMAKWDAVFLQDAHERLKGKMEGYDLSLRDVKDFVSAIRPFFRPSLIPDGDVRIRGELSRPICVYH